MPFASLRGIDFYYERRGEGPRLLFVNGTGGDLRMKPSFVDGPLAERFEILAHDQRGLGQTAKPDGPYSMADYADDAAALLEYVGWPRAHVLGVSFGGMVAQELALRHPERVDRLVLACTSSGGAGGMSYPLHELAARGPDAYLEAVLELGDTRWRDGTGGRDAPLFRKIAEFMRTRQRIDGDDEDPAAKAAGAQRQLEARRRHDTWDRLPGITAPTLVCGGRYDGIAEPANLENLARRIPGATLELFEGGHGFLLEDRRAFARIIEFLTTG